jgi:hypothetical protein
MKYASQIVRLRFLLEALRLTRNPKLELFSRHLREEYRDLRTSFPREGFRPLYEVEMDYETEQ